MAHLIKCIVPCFYVVLGINKKYKYIIIKQKYIFSVRVYGP